MVAAFKRYAAHPGGPFNDRDALVIGARLEQLEARLGRKVHTEDVIADARSRHSPLHRYFKWNVRDQVEAYLKQRAREIIKSVYVVFRDESSREAAPVRAFITERADRHGGYTNTLRLMSEPESRQALVQQALDEAQAWMQRWRHLAELSEVFALIERTAIAARRGPPRH